MIDGRPAGGAGFTGAGSTGRAGSGASRLAAKVYHNRKSSPPFAANQGKPMSNSDDLKSMGLKATIPRLKILALFEKTEVRHLTAEDVYRLLLAENLDIGLATVYRVLTQFEQAGLLERHYFESGKAVFELSPGQHMIIWCVSTAVRSRNSMMPRSNVGKPGLPGSAAS
jgi:hypothetical protein